MKTFFEKIFDVDNEDFTRSEMLIYGVILPLSLVALMGIAGWVSNL